MNGSDAPAQHEAVVQNETTRMRDARTREETVPVDPGRSLVRAIGTGSAVPPMPNTVEGLKTLLRSYEVDPCPDPAVRALMLAKKGRSYPRRVLLWRDFAKLLATWEERGEYACEEVGAELERLTTAMTPTPTRRGRPPGRASANAGKMLGPP
jgi:hypothetical protein